MKKVLTRVVALVAVARLWTGCSELDRVAWDIEEYGTVSVSAPMLVPVEKAKGFDFDLDKTAEFYFNIDRVEGALQLVRQEAFDLQLATRVQVETLLKTLGELQNAKTAEQADTVGKKLTAQALAVAALNQIAEGPAGAAAIEANPALKFGLDVLTSALGGGEPEEEQQSDGAPPATLGEAMAESSPAPATQPAAGGSGEAEEEEFKSLLPLPRPAKEVLISEKFREPLERFSGKVSISPRQALNLAANDKMTQDLFKWFAKPSGYGDNKQAYFCMMTVSCHPGFRTRNNFSADVMVMTELARVTSESRTLTTKSNQKESSRGETESFAGGPSIQPSIPDKTLGFASELDHSPMRPRKPFTDSFRRPLVTAIYPMLDSQVLDLRESLRDQLGIALSLGMLGFGTQAELLADYVRRIEQDAQTQTAFTVGSAYSAGGYNFGFRVEPRFVALDPFAEDGTGSANRLESTEFPAMVLLFVDKADLDGSVGGPTKNESGYNHIVFHTESRWLPRDWWTRLWKRQTEESILNRARELDALKPKLVPGTKMGDLEWATTKRRRWALAAAGLGSTIMTELPRVPGPAKDPKVKNDKTTFAGWLNAVSVFSIEGENLSSSNIFGADIDGRNCAVKVVSSKTVVVTCDAWGDGNDRQGKISLATSAGRLPAGSVEFKHQFDDRFRDKGNASIRVQRNLAGDIIGVDVAGGAFAESRQLLELIQDSLLCCEAEEHDVCSVCYCVGHPGSPCCGHKKEPEPKNGNGDKDETELQPPGGDPE